MPLDPAGLKLITERRRGKSAPSRMLDEKALKLIAERNGGGGQRVNVPDGTYRVGPGGQLQLADAAVYTPGQIKAEADTVNAIISQLYQDAVADKKLAQATRNAFYGFCNEWVAFYQNHTGWLDRLWFASADKIGDYRKRAADWRALLVKHGLKPSTPADTGQVPGVSASDLPWKWIILGVAGVAGLIALVTLGRKVILGGALEEAEMAAMAIADAARRKRHSKSMFSIT